MITVALWCGMGVFALFIAPVIPEMVRDVIAAVRGRGRP